MDFVFVVLLNVVLYTRPAEFVPALYGLPIYQVMLVGCLVFGFPVLVEQLSAPLSRRPITACVLGIAAAAVLSILAHLDLAGVWNTANMFLVILLYYLLLVGTLNTPERLQRFLFWLVLGNTFITALAVLHYHGIIEVPNLKFIVEGEPGAQLVRLGSTGLFGDPNDMSLMIVLTLIFSASLIGDRRQWLPVRLLWLGPMALLGHALQLTYSRGGLLALLAGVGAFLAARFGRKAIPVAAVAMPALLAVFAGRQADLDISGGSGQARIHLWDAHLSLFKANPLFGIGCDRWADHVHQVAHNAYIQAFAEIGFVGGTLFLGAFYLAARPLALFAVRRPQFRDPLLGRLYPYIAAAVACQAVGIVSLSRAFTITTYTILGLASVYLALVETDPPLPPRALDARLIVELTALGGAFVVATNYFIRFHVSYYQ